MLQHLRRTAIKLWLSKRTHSPKPIINAPNICEGEIEKSQTPYSVLELKAEYVLVSYFCFLSLSHLGLIKSNLFSPSACLFLTEDVDKIKKPTLLAFLTINTQPATKDLPVILSFQYPNSKLSSVK